MAITPSEDRVMTKKQMKKMIEDAVKTVDNFTPRQIELAKQSGLWFRSE